MTAKLSKVMQEGLKILFEKRKLYGDEFIHTIRVTEKTLWALKERKFVEHSHSMAGAIYVDLWKLTDLGVLEAEKLVGAINED